MNRNKLLAFPNFENSGYTYNLKIGQPVSVQRVFHMLGVNDTTGKYQFSTGKGDATYSPNSNTDRIATINTTPKFYGGFGNSLSYKTLSLDFLIQFVRQTGLNLFGSYQLMPGVAANIPTGLLDVWHNPGDHKPYQKLSQDFGGQPYNILSSYAQSSDFMYSDASFIRLKNVSLSWTFPESWKQKFHLQNGRIFMQGQNLFTITKYNGLDPESQNFSTPPYRTWTVGFNITP
jgi:hypothetical protein